MTGSRELLSVKEGWPSLPLLLAKESPKAGLGLVQSGCQGVLYQIC